MKKEKFNDFREFKKAVNASLRYCKASLFRSFFLVDVENLEIIKGQNGNFLEFYLETLKNSEYQYSQTDYNGKNLNMYLFVGKYYFNIAGRKFDVPIYKKYLGSNLDSYENKFTDSILQLLDENNLSYWLKKFA